jgi:hypothetical protein
MDNRRVFMRPVCPVPMFICRMKVENWQEKKGREEKSQHPYTPDW